MSLMTLMNGDGHSRNASLLQDFGDGPISKLSSLLQPGAIEDQHLHMIHGGPREDHVSQSVIAEYSPSPVTSMATLALPIASTDTTQSEDIGKFLHLSLAISLSVSSMQTYRCTPSSDRIPTRRGRKA